MTIEEQSGDVVDEGVLVYEILKKAGAPVGKELKGKNMAMCVLASARRWLYLCLRPRGIRSRLHEKLVIVADAVDGKPLSARQGPLRIVATGEKKPARSVRMLEKLRVIAVE